MRTLFAMLLLLAGMSSAGALNAQQPPPPSTSPDSSAGGEKLLFAPPQTLQKAYHSERVGSLTEYIPAGETVEDWTEMVTVQVFRGLKVDPAPFLQTIGRGLTKSCPGFTSPTGIINGQANGYPTSMLTVTCPLNPATGKPETTVFRIIKGRDALYSVQHAWRSAVSGEEVGKAALALRTVVVCDTGDTTHPCPNP